MMHDPVLYLIVISAVIVGPFAWWAADATWNGINSVVKYQRTRR